MKRFLVLYKASQAGLAQMMNASHEQQMAGVDAWMTWTKQAASSFVDLGSPLGDAVRVSKGGAAAASQHDLAGYAIMQAESKEALAATMKDHPHFMMPDGWIEIVEITPIPGM